jgi:hypothetical protein
MLGCHVRSSADQISLTTSCAVVLGESASLLKDLWFPVLGVVADYKTRSSQHINRPSNLLSQKQSRPSSWSHGRHNAGHYWYRSSWNEARYGQISVEGH